MQALIALFLAFMPQTPPAQPVEEPYKKIEISEPDVRAAAKVAMSATKLRGTLISAERHAISSNNLRLCLSMNRSGNYEFARVVLSRDDKKQRWTVTLWSWGSCGR